jgi:hypothetical protein
MRSVSSIMTLFDDESVHKKCTIMTKWNAMVDDVRNTSSDHVEEDVEAMLEFGKSYKLTIEEVPDPA